MRVCAHALVEPRRRRRATSGSRWSGTCGAVSALCGHCQLGPLLLCRDGPVVSYAEAAPLAAKKELHDRAARGDDAHDPREGTTKPKLAVWKFASCDGCQLTLLDCEDELLAIAGAVEIAHFPEATRAVVDGPVRRVAGRGVGDHRAGRRAHRRDPGGLPDAGRDRSLRHRRRHPGPAQLRRRQGVHLGGVRAAGVHLHPGHLDPGVRARQGRLRAARLPDRPADSCSSCSPPCWRAASPHMPHAQRLHRVQARGNSASWWRGTPCLGPVTQAGCGAICPAFDRGCYGCFGPMGTRTWPLTAQLRRLGMTERRGRPRVRHLQRGRPGFRVSREARRERHGQDTIRRSRVTVGLTSWPASRARAPCNVGLRDGKVEEVRAEDLRAAPLLRGVPAGPRRTLSRRTSPPGSAASARSPTR